MILIISIAKILVMSYQERGKYEEYLNKYLRDLLGRRNMD
jgi:hypothetical protein